MEELLQSDAFQKYQKVLIAVIAEYISPRLFSGKEDLGQLVGALGLAHQIIKAPLKIRDNEFTKKLINENIKRVKLEFIRETL